VLFASPLYRIKKIKQKKVFFASELKISVNYPIVSMGKKSNLSHVRSAPQVPGWAGNAKAAAHVPVRDCRRF
jgi:hypothetical protein